MDLQEATLSMALLMRNERDFFNANLSDKSTNRGPINTIIKEYEYLQSSTREFGNRLAANPNFFGVMESWKVYIIGKEGVSKESIMDAYKEDDVEKLLEKCGSMAVNIREYLQDKKHLICDMSAGEDGWDIAIRCTEHQSKLLCQELYKKYTRAIELELLVISRRFAGHCLPGLYSWEDAEKFLRIYGL